VFIGCGRSECGSKLKCIFLRRLPRFLRAGTAVTMLTAMRRSCARGVDFPLRGLSIPCNFVAANRRFPLLLHELTGGCRITILIVLTMTKCKRRANRQGVLIGTSGTRASRPSRLKPTGTAAGVFPSIPTPPRRIVVASSLCEQYQLSSDAKATCAAPAGVSPARLARQSSDFDTRGGEKLQ
jgi:hypothetical protein